MHLSIRACPLYSETDLLRSSNTYLVVASSVLYGQSTTTAVMFQPLNDLNPSQTYTLQ